MSDDDLFGGALDPVQQRPPSATNATDGRAAGDKPVDSVDNTVTMPPSGGHGTGDGTDRSTPAGGKLADSSTAATRGDGAPLRGSDLARAALAAARQVAKKDAKRRVVPRGTVGGSRSRRRWSSAGADDRDPQPLGRLASRIAADRGWHAQLAGGLVFSRWPALVGVDVAEHAKPIALKDGELTVQAESTAWATQLRLLQRQLLVKIAAGVGPNVVKKLKVQGPSAPSWRYGPRHVSGRGPRDTYG